MVTEMFACIKLCHEHEYDREKPADAGMTVSFGKRFAASDQFDAIFKEGMGLVERTASYLDGQGARKPRAARTGRGADATEHASDPRLLELPPGS